MLLLECLHRAPADQLERIAQHCGEWTGKYRDDLEQRVAACLMDRAQLRQILDELSPEEWAALKVIYFNGGDHGITVELCLQIVNLLSGRRRRGSSAALAALQDKGLIYVRSQNYRQVFFIPQDLLAVLAEILNQQIIRRVCLTDDEPVRPTLPANDLLEDVHRFLAYVYKYEVTLTQQGQIYKRHLRALLSLLGSDETEEEQAFGRYPEPLGYLVGYCMDRHLVRRADGRLAATPDLECWISQPDSQKRADLYDYWVDRYFYQDLQSFLAVLNSVEGRWVSLPRLAQEMEPLLNPSQRGTFFMRLKHHLSTFLAPLGLVELAQAGSLDTPDLACRVLPAGEAILCGDLPSEETAAEPPKLILQATFEVILPRPAPAATLWRLELMGDLVQRTDRTLTYRLTQQSIYRALKAGISGEEMLQFLEEASATGLPQNVAFDLQSWIKAYGQVYLQEVTLLRCASPMLAAQVKASRRTRRYVLGELTPTDLIVDGSRTRELMEALEADGLMPGPMVKQT